MIVKSWGVLLLASSLFLALSCLLTWLAIRFLRSNRDQVLATGALMPEQELTISEPGELVLLLETPRLSSDYRNFEFEIVEQATGEKARMKYGYARAGCCLWRDDDARTARTHDCATGGALSCARCGVASRQGLLGLSHPVFAAVFGADGASNSRNCPLRNRHVVELARSSLEGISASTGPITSYLSGIAESRSSWADNRFGDLETSTSTTARRTAAEVRS